MARRFACQERLPGRPLRKIRPSACQKPDLDAAGGARFGSVRGDVDNGRSLAQDHTWGFFKGRMMITNHSKPPQQALLLVLRRGRSRERGRWALPEI